MKNSLIIILTILTSLTSIGQNTEINTISGLTIDPNIKNEVEKNIEMSPEYDAYKNVMQVYANAVLAESFENDKLVFSSFDPKFKQLFKSFYLWKDGTLSIDGAFGLFGGIGFVINIKDNKATVFHMLSSDDFPTYSYKEQDSLIDRLEVPCTETKIILSEIPDSTKKQIIYGYVEFKSGDYYSVSGAFGENEKPKKKKNRANMRIYFKSSYLNIGN